MTNTAENCTENVVENDKIATKKNEHFNEKETQKQDCKIEPLTEFPICYLLQVNGDPEFRLTAKSARKNGVKAEFTIAGWVYQNRKAAEEVAKRWVQGKRKISVVPWHDSLVYAIWNGSEEEARLAKKSIRLRIKSHRINEKREEIILQCHLTRHFHHSWLYAKAENVPEDLKKEYEYFKPLWDKTFEEESEIDLNAADLAREIEDIKEEANQLIPFDNVLKSLMRNERGDAELFLNLLKHKYIFDSTEGKNGDFYLWTGTNWKLDRGRQRHRDIEIIADIYEKASIETGKDEKKKDLSELLNKRAYSLRSIKRCKSVFEFISTEIPFSDEWDYCPEKLPCINGIVDLKTGQLCNHKPEFFIRSICPTSYNPHAKSPLFDKFLDDITLGDKELKSFLCRVLGFALLGTSKEEKVFIFYGKDGRNGKGTLMQTLERVLGPFAKTFASEMLLLQRNPPSSSTPRPEKANLQGVRFAIFSEIDEKRQIDASEIKNLSGRDTITCRRLFSNVDIQIRPSHTMFIQTNFKPKASAKDGALWKRNILVPFNAEFVEEPTRTHERKIDEEFKEKLLLESEGILNRLIEGCLEYQRNGLAIPKVVRDETANYRKENDGILLFIEDKCTLDPALTAQCREMQRAIKDYCQNQGHNIPNEREISSWLRECFGDPKRSSRGTYYQGIGITPDESCNERCND